MKTGIILKQLTFSPLRWLEHLGYHLGYKAPEGIPGQRQRLVPGPKGLEEKHGVFNGQVEKTTYTHTDAHRRKKHSGPENTKQLS